MCGGWFGFFTASQLIFFNRSGGSHSKGLLGCGSSLLQEWWQWQRLHATGGGGHLEQGKAAGPQVAAGMSLTHCPCMARHHQAQHPSMVVTTRTQTYNYLPVSSEDNREAGSPERDASPSSSPSLPKGSRPWTVGAEGRAPALILISPGQFSGQHP